MRKRKQVKAKKRKTFRQFCKVGTIITPEMVLKIEPESEEHTIPVSRPAFHTQVNQIHEDSLTVTDQGHHRHHTTTRKFRKYLKRKGVL